MKKLTAGLIVLVLLAASFSPALAAGKNPPKDGGKGKDTPAATQKAPQGNAFGHSKQAPATGPKAGPNAPAAPKVKQPKKGDDPAAVDPATRGKGRGAFVVGGSIIAVDAISGTVTIAVYHGNARAHGVLSQTITVTLSAATRYQLNTLEGTEWATIDDLQPGQNVMVKGWTDADDWSVDWLKINLGLGRQPYALPQPTEPPTP